MTIKLWKPWKSDNFNWLRHFLIDFECLSFAIDDIFSRLEKFHEEIPFLFLSLPGRESFLEKDEVSIKRVVESEKVKEREREEMDWKSES